MNFADCFSLEGANNPGIIHKVANFLSQNGLSIQEMKTSDELAPEGGTVLFSMTGLAHAYEPMAAGFDISIIKSKLKELGDDLNCDISLKGK